MTFITPSDAMFLASETREHPMHVGGLHVFRLPDGELLTGFVDRIVRDATDESLAREVPSPNGGTATVGDCVRVVLGEEWWHHHYANRDLATFTQTAGRT